VSASRRTILRGASALVALTGIVGGVAWQRRRKTEALESEPIAEPWAELGPQGHWLRANLQSAQMVVPDRPHRVEEAREPDRRASLRRTRRFSVSTNADRLRMAEITPTPAPGVTRLVAIGDSVTFGWGVEVEDAFPAQLQAELNRRGHKVEVLNAGVPGQHPPTMGTWLNLIAPRLGVSGVVFSRRVAFNGPNPIQGYADAVRTGQRGLPNARFQLILPPISRFDAGSLTANPAGEGGLIRQQLPNVPLLDLTDTFRAAQGERGYGLKATPTGKLALVNLASGEALVEASADGRDLPWAICDALDEDDSLREPLMFDSGHPDAEGFVVYARAVADQLEAGGWFSA
jgi:lysophospholipase L1-like esterase